MKTGLRVIWASAILLAVGLAALLVIVAMTFLLVQGAQDDLDGAIGARNLATAAVQLRHGLEAAESSQRGYIVSGNDIYLEPYGTAKALSFQQLQQMIDLMAPDQKDSPAVKRLEVLVNDKFDELDATIDLKRAGKDAAALGVVRTNRGKLLMDEANAFLSKTIFSANSALTDQVAIQKDGLFRLRRTVAAAAGMILAVVAIAVWMITGFSRNIGRARDTVTALNADLERRVELRTVELAAERDRAEILLSEVNHRVANSLALVASMVRLQSRSADSDETRDALTEAQTRIGAIALVHKTLYSSGDVRSVALSEFLTSLLKQLEVTMQDAGHQAQVKADIAALTLPTDRTVSLGVIVAEWVTNAFKYAYPDGAGEIRVSLQTADKDAVELRVEDDGVGRRDDEEAQGTGVGTKLVNAMAGSLGGQIDYVDRQPGTTARLVLPVA
ncbi:MAG: CHASE3 domain-containing protein [bacterium]